MQTYILTLNYIPITVHIVHLFSQTSFTQASLTVAR